MINGLFAYIGVNQTGSVRAICCDDPGCEASTAEIVRDWIRMGRTVERHPMDEAMRRFKNSADRGEQ